MSELAPSTPPPGADVVRPRPDVAMVEIDGEGVLYDPVAERVHVLNPTATLVWSLFDASSSLGELADALAPATGVERHVVLADLSAMVARLLAEGLVEVLATPPAANVTPPHHRAVSPTPT